MRIRTCATTGAFAIARQDVEASAVNQLSALVSADITLLVISFLISTFVFPLAFVAG